MLPLPKLSQLNGIQQEDEEEEEEEEEGKKWRCGKCSLCQISGHINRLMAVYPFLCCFSFFSFHVRTHPNVNIAITTSKAARFC